ncbi:MAG: alpha-hydroxy-acid oxidizing protein [Bryobacteraceae bacterium]|nr:alpha-hydroxy-acid oxidizing protein [Bryobacteraceae bacterium]MDW8377945.1 alpha-hydroxy acid oxidase [Bryobacterales bacterium]
MILDRRQALKAVFGWAAGSPLALAQGEDPLYGPLNVFDFAELAKKKLDPLAWDYLEGGSEDEASLRDNRAIFRKVIIRPRALVDVHKIDLSLELFGKKLDYPILLDPAGGKNCFYPNGELEVSKAAARAKALHITNGGIEEFLESGQAPVWWQVTTGGQFQNPQSMRSFVQRLESMGCSGICFTVDIMHVSHRERDIRNRLERAWCETGLPKRDADGRMPPAKNPWRVGVYPSRPAPTPTWNTLRELTAMTKLPVIVKGILTGEDAARCVESGASCVMVSNHGARQLDHVGSTLEALPEVVRAVQGRIPVLVDGGFRRGTDILKGLALGAKAVAIARPYLYGLAAFGGRGVERVLELLKTELALDMALAGVPTLASIDSSLVRFRDSLLE